MITLSNQSKNTIGLSNQSADLGRTWNESTMSWDENNDHWDKSTINSGLDNPTKNNISLNLPNK